MDFGLSTCPQRVIRSRHCVVDQRVKGDVSTRVAWSFFFKSPMLSLGAFRAALFINVNVARVL